MSEGEGEGESARKVGSMHVIAVTVVQAWAWSRLISTISAAGFHSTALVQHHMHVMAVIVVQLASGELNLIYWASN